MIFSSGAHTDRRSGSGRRRGPGPRQLAKWIEERQTHSHMAWVAAAARGVVAGLLLIVRAAGNQYSVQTNPRPHRASRKRGPTPRLHKSRGPHRSLGLAPLPLFFLPLPGNKLAGDAAAVTSPSGIDVRPIRAHGRTVRPSIDRADVPF